MRPTIPVLLFVALSSGFLSPGCALDPVRTAAHERVERGAVLLDVRTAEEFASGHVEGAINIPLDQLDERMAELGPKDQSVVVYCRSGKRSASATRMLHAEGFTQVLDLGPMARW